MTEHGTYAGYNAHYGNGVFKDLPMDEACQEAANEYARKRRAKLYLRRTDSMWIDATGTKRRIQALARMGWPYSTVGRHLNHYKNPSHTVWHLLNRQGRVHIDTAAKVDELYRQLSTKRGPDLKAQRRAIKNGWAPPAAWDDIDNPDEKPQGMTDKEIVA